MLHRWAPARAPRRRPATPPPRLARVLAPLALLVFALAGPARGQDRAEAAPAFGDAAIDLLAAVNAERIRSALAPLELSPALSEVAAGRAADAAATGSLDSAPSAARDITRRMRRAGYPPYAWRQRLVQGPGDAAAVVRQWRASDPDGFEEVVLGDFQGFGAARVEGSDAPIWSLLFALPRIAWERRQAEPLGDVDAVRAGVLAAVNAERRAAGLAPLRTEARLHVVAAGHAEDMARRGFFDHLSPEGATPMDRVRQGGYAPHRVAENLAKGLFDPAEVVRRWMLSPGHRRNILDPAVREVGIAVVAREEGQEVLPLWVLVLAAPA